MRTSIAVAAVVVLAFGPAPHATATPPGCGAQVLLPDCAGVPDYEYADVAGHQVAVVRPRFVVEVRRGAGGSWGSELVAVPGPCAYYRVWTGAWMYDWPAPELLQRTHPASHDAFIDYARHRLTRIVLPNGIGSIEPDTDQSGDDRFGHIGSSLGVSFGEVAAHRGDNVGYWWIYQCSIAAYAGLKAYPPETVRREFLRWHSQVAPWRFWRPGEEDPPVITLDRLLIPDVVAAAVGPLNVEAAPPLDRNVVAFPTWVWESADSRGPVEVRTGSITARAVPGPLRLAGPLPSTVDTSGFGCAGGGTPFPYDRRPEDSETDCTLLFHAPLTGTTIRFAQHWRVSIQGVPAGSFDRTSQAYLLHAREMQVTSGR